jgi:hypothetical protein
MISRNDWLLLVSTLPVRQAAARMRLWRSIKGLGCAVLRDGVYLLPASAPLEQAFEALAQEIQAAQGQADVLRVLANDAQQPRFVAHFDRSADYGHLLSAIRDALHAGPSAQVLKKLQREWDAMRATDYFEHPAREQVHQALAELQAVISGEPRPGAGVISKRSRSRYVGRTWATRQNLWVDRMACAWLIRRFIDPRAHFLWLKDPAQCPKAALGFDFDGATFTHVGHRVTFEVLIRAFSLDQDRALSSIAAIVHALDVGGAPVAQAAGIEAVLQGLRSQAPDDDALLAQSLPVFDALYQHYLTLLSNP